MRTIIILSCSLCLISCQSAPSRNEMQALKDELTSFNTNQLLEAETRQGIEDYIKDLNAEDWYTNLEKRQPNDNAHKQFLERYQHFRNAYQDMNLEIKHLLVEGNEGILWLIVTATHANQTEDIIKNVTPSGKKVTWQEVWYFDMQQGEFGKKWDILVREVDKMQSVGEYQLPEDYFEIDYYKK